MELGADAREELRRILTGLGRQSPAAAGQLERRIDEVMGLVLRYPRVGRVVYPEADVEYRSVVADSYVLWYEIREGGEVIVLAILHGRRRQPTLTELAQRGEEQP